MLKGKLDKKCVYHKKETLKYLWRIYTKVTQKNGKAYPALW